MEYKPLTRNNPTDVNLTTDSSVWLASRIMPGKGNDKISFTHYRIINNTGARTADFEDLKINGLICIDDNEKLIDCSLLTEDLVWKGCWTINEKAVIGYATETEGLVSPFNTFNIGNQYKKGWKPAYVN